MSKTTVGDAYQQKKGDLRHYAEAVEVCLKANEDDIIHIENYGDISTLTTSIEVKDLESSITLNSYQVWNTLKNWVSDFQTFNQFDKLILFTTSPVVTDRSISEWNKLNSSEKYKRLLDSVKSIKSRKNASQEKIDLTKQVLNFDNNYTKEDLLIILDRFYICLSSIDDKKKYDEILELEVFKLHTKENAKKIIDGVISFIFQKGLKGTEKWQINISELHRILINLGANVKRNLPKRFKKCRRREVRGSCGCNRSGPA